VIGVERVAHPERVCASHVTRSALPLAWMTSYQPSVNPLRIAIRVGAPRSATIDASTVVPSVALTRGHADSTDARWGRL
jgi:hypothetical protein